MTARPVIGWAMSGGAVQLRLPGMNIGAQFANDDLAECVLGMLSENRDDTAAAFALGLLASQVHTEDAPG